MTQRDPQSWSPGPPTARLAALNAAADAHDREFGSDRDRARWFPPMDLRGLRQHRTPAQDVLNVLAKRRQDEAAGLNLPKRGRPCKQVISDRDEWFKNVPAAAKAMRVSDVTLYNAITRSNVAKGRRWFYVSNVLDAQPEQIIAALSIAPAAARSVA